LTGVCPFFVVYSLNYTYSGIKPALHTGFAILHTPYGHKDRHLVIFFSGQDGAAPDLPP